MCGCGMEFVVPSAMVGAPLAVQHARLRWRLRGSKKNVVGSTTGDESRHDGARRKERRRPTRVVKAVGALSAFMAAFALAAPVTQAALPAPIASSIGTAFPSVPLPASADPLDLPVASASVPTVVPWKGGTKAVDSILEDTATRAFLVLHHGRIVHEWYDDHTTADTPLSSWSMAKSMMALVTGEAVDKGILSLTDPVVKWLPRLRTGTSFDTVTIEQLLDMRSGIDVPEGYTSSGDVLGSVTGLFGTPTLYLWPDLNSYVRGHRSMHFAPGTRGEYASYNTQLLSMVLTAAFKRPVIDVFRDTIWQSARASRAATWNYDRPGGIAKGFCCLNATARDFARLGLLVANAGTPASPVTNGWANRIFQPLPKPVLDDHLYSTGFWHLLTDGTSPNPPAQPDATMLGVFGQYTYINRKDDTVIVKLGDDDIVPATINDQTAAFRYISDALASSSG
jgi:CubicO group peptidase (beta-lactamase class C family)